MVKSRDFGVKPLPLINSVQQTTYLLYISESLDCKIGMIIVLS